MDLVPIVAFELNLVGRASGESAVRAGQLPTPDQVSQRA